MKSDGPDSLRSWMVAGACCFLNTMLFGMNRLSGILFVATVARFQLTRKQASFPYTFASFIKNTAGPLVGFLGHKFGVRLVSTFGCFLAAFGIGTCFFGENIASITVTWGALFGLGFGLGNGLLPVKINQYFDKYRATASGISFSGACLGSFILPPVIEFLLDTYELSGTFLVMSGIVLNCVPAALLLREPGFKIKSPKQQHKGGRKQYINSEKTPETNTMEGNTFITNDRSVISTNTTTNNNENSTVKDENGKVKLTSTQPVLPHIPIGNPQRLKPENAFENGKGTGQRCHADSLYENKLSFDQNSSFAAETDSINLPYSHNATLSDGSIISFQKSKTEQLSKNFNVDSVFSDDKDFRKSRIIDKNFTNCKPSNKGKSTISSFSVILDPVFLLVAITNAFYSYSFVCMTITIVDFARDLNVGFTNEKYVLMALSIGDFIGRLGLGWVTDSGYLTRANFASLCFLCQGVTVMAIALSTTFSVLMTLATLYGFSQAGLIVIYPLIVAEFIEEEKQTIAIPCSYFLAGPLCLTIAPLIGFFRDTIGSYEYFFFGIGVILFICCVAWLLLPLLLKCRRRKE